MTVRPLSPSRPRAVRLTAAGRVLVVVAVLMFAGALAGGLVLYFEARQQAADRQRLGEHGVTASAEVIRLWPNGENHRRVLYRFVVDGQAHERRVTVSAERRQTLQLGSTLQVRYVPERPDLNDLADRPSAGGLPVPMAFLVGGSLFGGGLLCLFPIKRQRELLTEGRLASAIVTGHRLVGSTHHGKHRTITYEFRLLSGAVRKGTSGVPGNAPAIGSVISVVYDPDQPNRSMVYPFVLVQSA